MEKTALPFSHILISVALGKNAFLISPTLPFKTDPAVSIFVVPIPAVNGSALDAPLLHMPLPSKDLEAT